MSGNRDVAVDMSNVKWMEEQINGPVVITLFFLRLENIPCIANEQHLRTSQTCGVHIYISRSCF